ncbi:ERF superfamily protein [Desulfomicrobium apsheronum]|uniref:ERF superfamily protein n=1 Tax=Desulfomicrobium apsheronum TaxID=52560 RepID=A0A1I3PI44_9BACT|nr:ERF family protein [Desulfomicrobium apsheronum]SFJ21037.1 ERF superfamily protein [Desulfomicrobium apsheronum]
MHDQNYCSSETTKLAKALIQVQRTLQPATKDRLNPFTHSNYATLNSVMDSCREALLTNGIWLTQYPVPSEPGHLGLVTKLVHAESGEWQASHAVVPLPKNDPQGLGIAMTYIRRYSISAMLGIVTEEDTDVNVPKDSGKNGARPKRQAVANASRESSLQSPPPITPSLPKLDGITYQEITATDGQVCIVATGNTQSKKELLAGAGFKWNPQRKMWWKYAQAS